MADRVEAVLAACDLVEVELGAAALTGAESISRSSLAGDPSRSNPPTRLARPRHALSYQVELRAGLNERLNGALQVLPRVRGRDLGAYPGQVLGHDWEAESDHVDALFQHQL